MSGREDLVPAHVRGPQHEVGHRRIAELGERPPDDLRPAKAVGAVALASRARLARQPRLELLPECPRLAPGLRVARIVVVVDEQDSAGAEDPGGLANERIDVAVMRDRSTDSTRSNEPASYGS